MKFIRLVLWQPLRFALALTALYFITIHLIPFWNEWVVPKCIFALKFSDSGVTTIFVPIFLVLVGYAFFDKYKLYEELETSCHLVKAEFEANEHLMRFFEDFVINECDNAAALKEFNTNTKFCVFRNFQLDRLKIRMTHIKPNSSLEQRLNKWRSKTSQTIDLLNHWLASYRQKNENVQDLEKIKEFLMKKFIRLREERTGMMDVINELFTMNKLDEMNLVIKSVKKR